MWSQWNCLLKNICCTWSSGAWGHFIWIKCILLYCKNNFLCVLLIRINLLNSFFLSGTRKLEYAGNTWHEGCFICSSCKQPIGSKSFIPDKDDHYCVPCYENKFAPRCTRCKQVSIRPLKQHPGFKNFSHALLIPNQPKLNSSSGFRLPHTESLWGFRMLNRSSFLKMF